VTAALLWLGGLLLAAAIALLVYRLLMGITAKGGNSKRDATETVDLFLGEANAFRGSRSAGDPPLDGHNRIAPPTQDGGFTS
jgi:hypothetical protein